MKKSLLLLAAFAVAAFVGLTLLKRSADEHPEPAPTANEADRQQIQAFWTTYHQANALRAERKFAEAAAAYHHSLQLNPQHEDSLYYLGTSLQELGEYSEAAATFRKMSEMNPGSSRALSQLGYTLSLLKPGAPVDFPAAREAFQRSLQLNREEAGPFLRLGLLELSQGRLQAAREQFRIAAGFGSPEGNFLVGYTHFLQRRYEESSRYFAKVLEMYGRERRISARGVLSEGDVLPAAGKPLSGLEKSALKSMLFLFWAAEQLGGYPKQIPEEVRLHRPAVPKPGFEQANTRVGLKLSGGRVAWGDFDRDGLVDLVVVGLGQPVTLYRNLGGQLADVTQQAGLGGVRDAWDAVWADYDGDGYPDLYLVRSGFIGQGQNALYRNSGHRTFSDVTAAMGLGGERATARALFADCDGDGLLDLLELGAAEGSSSSLRLFRHTGQRYQDHTQQAGLKVSSTAVDAALGDYNQDGRTDLLVVFWQRDAVLYRNEGNARFADVTEPAGLQGTTGQRFSALWFDYNNDRLPDLLLTAHAPVEDVVRGLLQVEVHVRENTPRLFRNKGDGSFQELTAEVGLQRAYGTMQALALDVDSDGWTDLLLANGSLDNHRLEPSVVLHNQQGKSFQEWLYLPDFTQPSNFLGAAVVDFNRDGAPDIYLAVNPRLSTAQVAPALYLNLHRQRGSASGSR
ncbi:MAG: VCBS repeat-containing protein [Acidobacteria bacterium]|nr:VCBS repeat-containing protein [Acidobacteriota bacterium]